MSIVSKTLSLPLRWNPEDPDFWASRGREVALRNLGCALPALALSFAVWMLWSVLVVYLPAAGFRYSTNQLFWLSALPALCGATLRIFYGFAVSWAGGRRWTALSTASLLAPVAGVAQAVQDPSTPYEWMVVLALLCGLGGANFASGMAHISACFPAREQGVALGLGAGFAHLGVGLVQWLVPAAIALDLFGLPPQGAGLWLQNAGLVWLPLIAAASLLAWLGMDDLPGDGVGLAEQAQLFTRRHSWLMSWLYLGSFGSFIGFAAAYPLLLRSQFPGLEAAQQLAWIGPLLGAMVRPLGGWAADDFGGARISLACFAAMALGVGGVVASLGLNGAGGGAPLFIASFVLLFLAAGVANGSTFRMVPLGFVREAQAGRGSLLEAQARGAAALGLCSAVGAYGGFFIPKSFGSAIALNGGPQAALYCFLAFYLSCMAICWWFYGRRNAPLSC
ncbi:MFS transporter [Roseateles saccharophilus]|uniref:NNP family nitrate/nitrite transporter-like MFS transporter n=1 Tax=Roseateles saccharophilus TaxID=304 RepID=A0A4R3V1K1_ROSSA|nr:MFS transporter [Roseateles saccharophilus]MDG0832333.1 nitrate/nitrite transporter [Roseateles saccharophilus]TCU97027.1 NNP family nitrate/nitrite transporter-like MFS transporter [Roseateles saccharophilus]